MRGAIGPMLGWLIFAVGCGQADVRQVDDGGAGVGGEAGSGGVASGGGGEGGLPGGGGVEVLPLTWNWESRQPEPGARDVACDDDGRCVALVVGGEEIDLVDLQTGTRARWVKDPAMDGDLRFGRVEWSGDRFVVVGGVGYTGVVLVERAGDLDLVFRSDTADVCSVADASACRISSPFASVTMAGDDLYALHWDGLVLRGTGGPADWALFPASGGGLFFTALAGSADGQLFAAAFDGLYRFEHAAWSRVDEAVGLEQLWTDGNGFFAGAGSGGLLLAGEAGDIAIESLDGAMFADVWGASRDAVLAVGSGGRVVRYDGEGWEDLRLPEAEERDLVAVSGSRSGEVVILAADGTLLRGVPIER